MNLKKLIIRTVFISGLFSPLILSAQYKFYFGNIHAHSSYSDGCKECTDDEELTPKDCYKFAKESEHFDFLGISEHNHSQAQMKDKANYHQGIADADAENEDGEFVCMYGMEFGTNEFGHVLVYGVDKLLGWEEDLYEKLCRKDDYNKLWSIINNTPGAFATLAHPEGAHFSRLSQTAKKTAADKAICGTAIRNGPHASQSLNYDDPPATSYYGYYKKLLALGYRVGPTIDHDNHYMTFGRTAASRTVILARKLHRDSIMAAYKAMRFYASEDWNAEVTLTIKGRHMGSEFTSNADPVINVHISDADSDDEIEYIIIMSGKAGSGTNPKQIASVTNSDFIIHTDTTTHTGGTYYYYAEIKQKDKDLIITSPVWVKVAH